MIVNDLLTTQQLQSLLMVDRTTIYRMAKRGDIPAIRVGNQWRFPKAEVEAWLSQRSGGDSPGPTRADRDQPADPVGQRSQSPDPNDADRLFPLECVQKIQDAFAEIAGVTVLVTDPHGTEITRVSNPSGLWEVATSSEAGAREYRALWQEMGADPTLQSRTRADGLGLLWARGLVRDGKEVKALALVGGIASENWPPSPEIVREAGTKLGLPESRLNARLAEVHRLEGDGQKRLLPFVQRIADILGHILEERMEVASRMDQIARLTVMEPWSGSAK
jgi:excisionase family DNA binding protein